MSSNEVIFSLVILGPLGLIALVQLFSDGVKYGFGEDGSLMTPAQVSVMLKAVGGLFLVALVVVGGIWIYNELNDDKTDSREFTSEESDDLFEWCVQNKSGDKRQFVLTDNFIPVGSNGVDCGRLVLVVKSAVEGRRTSSFSNFISIWNKECVIREAKAVITDSYTERCSRYSYLPSD